MRNRSTLEWMASIKLLLDSAFYVGKYRSGRLLQAKLFILNYKLYNPLDCGFCQQNWWRHIWFGQQYKNRYSLVVATQKTAHTVLFKIKMYQNIKQKEIVFGFFFDEWMKYERIFFSRLRQQFYSILCTIKKEQFAKSIDCSALLQLRCISTFSIQTAQWIRNKGKFRFSFKYSVSLFWGFIEFLI